VNRQLIKEDKWMANKHMTCPVSLVIRETQVRVTMRFYFTFVGMENEID
jgi:hypothetical protein